MSQDKIQADYALQEHINELIIIIIIIKNVARLYMASWTKDIFTVCNSQSVLH